MYVFEVGAEHIGRMGPDGAVELIRDLIYADASASGIPYDKIDVPSITTAADGGVDGVVGDAPAEGRHGIVKKGHTYYQIKSGKFERTGLRRILFDGEKLKGRIKSCLDKDGTLVLAFTGWDNPDTTDDGTKDEIMRHLKGFDPKYAGASVEVWRQNTIAGFLRDFPSLRLKVPGMKSANFLHHGEWSSQKEMRRRFYRGKEQDAQIGQIRGELRKDSGPLHVRISGAPGVGKTRLIQEVTNTDDLRPFVAYAENPSVLGERGFLANLCRNDDKSKIILVVDECDFARQADLWDKLEGKEGVRLITIFNDSKKSTGATKHFEVKGLEPTEITRILQDYVGGGQDLAAWASFCGSSARAAHIVGNNLKEYPEDVLASPDTVDVWGRYIADKGVSHDSSEFETKLNVMMWLSLFKRFEKGPDGEIGRIRRLLEAKGAIPEAKFNSVLRKMQDRKIIQGHTTLYITPKALHVYLWIKWWEECGSDMFPSEELDPNGDDSLLDQCTGMFEYAGQVPEARKIAADLFESGWFAKNGLESRVDRRFFLNISRLVPSHALAFVENLLGGKGREELLEFTQGRRETVLVLERIAGHEKYFARASRLLQSLAEAENEGFSNNASGAFCNLFAPGSSEASLPVLAEALKHAAASDKHGRAVTAKACRKALENPAAFWRIGDKADSGPRPATEVAGYRKAVLGTLARFAFDSDKGVAAEAVGAVLENARPMLHAPDLSRPMMDALSAVLESGAHSEELLEATSRITEFGEHLEPEILDGLRLIQDKITGTGFHARLKRCVGMPIHINEYTGADSRQARDSEIEKLADEASEQSVLEPELEWLVTDRAKYAHRFGYELARRDSRRALFATMLDALAKSGGRRRGALVGGYLRKVREDDAAEWDGMMDKVYLNADTRALLPDITRVSGVTASSLARIVRGVRDGRIECSALSVSKYATGLPESAIRECIEILLAGGGDAVLAVDLLRFHFVKPRKSLPTDLALRALLHERILNSPEGGISDAWEWGEVGTALVRQCPECGAKIAEAVLGVFGSSWFFSHPDAPPVQVLEEIAKLDPGKTWDLLSSMIGPPSDGRARHIQAWLRGGLQKKSAMLHMPMPQILAWASEEEGRAAHLAGFVPHDWNIIRGLASAYGHRDDFKRSLSLNLDTEIWTGSETEHYSAKKEEIEALAKGESDPGVLEWLGYYLKQTERNLERARREEERGMLDVYS